MSDTKNCKNTNMIEFERNLTTIELKKKKEKKQQHCRTEARIQ